MCLADYIYTIQSLFKVNQVPLHRLFSIIVFKYSLHMYIVL